MSRGHQALQLLDELLVELDKQPGPIQAVMRLRPEWPYVVRARTLVREAVAAPPDPTSASDSTVWVNGTWCSRCQAIHHPLTLEPESHGARRTS